MPVTTMRLPTKGGVSISLTALKNYLSISLPMEKRPKEVERLLMCAHDGTRFVCRHAIRG